MFFAMSPHKMKIISLSFFYLITLSFLAGCNNERVPVVSGCINCHKVELDQHHQLGCTSCHHGNNSEATIEKAHAGLVNRPAHPENSEEFCGPCHQEAVEMTRTNDHYTLSGYFNALRLADPAFAADNLSDIKASASPASDDELLHDMLRRKCFRCHVYTTGDNFPNTSRATGCGSCHLSFFNSAMKSHHFRKNQGDEVCLTCHYGNRVGFDYYGRYEHDYNEEYRTPYTTENDFFRPYGVEYHQLEPDIHQKAGMLCVDCHRSEQVMGSGSVKADCSSCHDATRLKSSRSESISGTNDQYIFTSAATGKIFNVPIMTNPAHLKFNEQIGCQVCHAQWSFNDSQTHLLRIDHDYLDQFEKLTLDGDYRTNRIITSNIEFEAESILPATSDFFTDALFPGIWLKGYGERRWEEPKLTRDTHGILRVGRPILDIHLSWIDSGEIVRFDSIEPFSGGVTILPYVPHTTGPAGPFYELRIKMAEEEGKKSAPANQIR